jgi:hypothetical protein
MHVLNIFFMIMLSSLNHPPTDLFFEYKSQGTYSRQMIEVKVYTDRVVHYKRSKFAPLKVVEEWKGTLNDADYQLFVKELVENCKFMELPQKPDEEMRVKDSSDDEITVYYTGKKHQIGGYAAFHYSKYKCVYHSYHKMLFSVKNQRYQVKPKS